jgi:nucleobase:cation symporter-1, NCS1 family
VKDEERAWGVTPVPERLQTLSALDVTLLWGNLGVSLLVLVAGAFLVPALSLPDALVAIVVGGLVGNVMLGLAGMIGADGRVPAMVLMRAPLGRRGSYLPTALNVTQCLGWAVFELIIIAAAASALSEEFLGFGGRALWTIVCGAAALALALLGPVGVVRRVLRRFAVWIVLASLVYLTWWALAEADLSALWQAPGEGGTSLVLGIDLVIAITVSWTPLAADYTRFARDRRGAFVGTGIGYFLAGTWMFVLGAFVVLARGLADPVEVPAGVAAAGLASGLALLAVTVDETDEAFANIYSAAVSLQNLLPAMSQRLLVGLVSLLATVGALTIELRDYETFLLLLGSFFVPLFGVLLADWLLSGAGYRPDDFFAAPALKIGPIVAWIAGFALYQWLHPLGPPWWTALVANTSPPGVGIGSSLPSFALAFALTALAIRLGSRGRRASVASPTPVRNRG